jgi:RHS repeat-associated protein
MKNHLGNVLLVVTDLKLGQEIGSADDTTDYYLPEVVAANDYYPFGMPMSFRTWQGGTYRYGFNGKEADGEWSGEGNSYDFGARMYEGRLGRWMSVDPYLREYPSISSFSAFGCSPITIVDPGGETLEVAGIKDIAFHDFQMLLAPGNQRQLIQLSDDGTIVWSQAYHKLSVAQKVEYAHQNAGFATVSALINSAQTYRHEVLAPEAMHTTGYQRTRDINDPSSPINISPEFFDNPMNVGVGTTWLNSAQMFNAGIYAYDQPGHLPIDGLGGHNIFPSIPYIDGNSNLRYSFIFHEWTEAFLMNEGATELINISAKWPDSGGQYMSGGLNLPLGSPLPFMLGGRNVDLMLINENGGYFYGSHTSSSNLERRMWWMKYRNNGGHEFINRFPGAGAGNPVTKEMLENSSDYVPQN